MTTSLAIPASPADLTSEWIEHVLRHAGYDSVVANVHVAPIGTGQMASSLRVAIDYTHGPADAPESVVVKIASLDPNSRGAGAAGAYEREVRYYQHLDADLAIATPRSYWADINIATSDFALVLEDMHPATQGDQIAGCSIDELRQAAVNVAGLHAPRWGDESLFELPWLSSPRDELPARYGDLKEMLAMFTPGFIDRYRDRIDERHIQVLTWGAKNVVEWLSNDDGPFGLQHGDYRLDNLLFDSTSEDRPVAAVDWQTVTVRSPVSDISYLLGTSVEPEVRRSVEADVVAAYHARLGELGVTDYSLDDCIRDYHRGCYHTPIITVLGSMLTGQTARGDDMFMAMLHRSTDQIFDLQPPPN